jgi:hypothetical protein
MTDGRATSNRVRPGPVDPVEFRRWADTLWNAVWDDGATEAQLPTLKALVAWMDGEAYKMDGRTSS